MSSLFDRDDPEPCSPAGGTNKILSVFPERSGGTASAYDPSDPPLLDDSRPAAKAANVPVQKPSSSMAPAVSRLEQAQEAQKLLNSFLIPKQRDNNADFYTVPNNSTESIGAGKAGHIKKDDERSSSGGGGMNFEAIQKLALLLSSQSQQ